MSDEEKILTELLLAITLVREIRELCKDIRAKRKPPRNRKRKSKRR